MNTFQLIKLREECEDALNECKRMRENVEQEESEFGADWEGENVARIQVWANYCIAKGYYDFCNKFQEKEKMLSPKLLKQSIQAELLRRVDAMGNLRQHLEAINLEEYPNEPDFLVECDFFTSDELYIQYARFDISLLDTDEYLSNPKSRNEKLPPYLSEIIEYLTLYRCVSYLKELLSTVEVAETSNNELQNSKEYDLAITKSSLRYSEGNKDKGKLKEFAELIHHPNKPAIMKKLHELLCSSTKPKDVAITIKALIKLSYIANYGSHAALYEIMRKEFNISGTNSGLNQFLNENRKNMTEEELPIIKILESVK